MENTKKLTIEEWEAKYRPVVNPNAEDECSADRFETYGEDLEFVLKTANATPKKVWTLEDIDGQLIICTGYHLANRINYFITELEWEDDNIEVQYCDEDSTDDIQKLYVVKFFDTKEFNVCLGFNALKEYCEKLALEDFAIEIDGKTEVLEQAFNKGNKSHLGFYVDSWKKDVSDELAYKACQEIAEIGGAEIEVLCAKKSNSVKSVVGFGSELELKLVEFETEAEVNAYLKGLEDMEGWNGWFAMKASAFNTSAEADRLKFSTVDEGFEAIKRAYQDSEVCEGEFANYLVLNYDKCFDASIDPTIAIQAIQKFRQWGYEPESDVAFDAFGDTEELSENQFYGFMFMSNGQEMQLPDGVRVGIKQEDGGIVLDEGITACFTKVKYGLVSGYFTEDNEPFENYRIAIGQWDGVTNDDDIFHWFSYEDKIIGVHADFVITTYLKDGDSEDKRVTATPRFGIIKNTKILEDYNDLETAMEAYNYIKENGCHKSENDGEIMLLESGTEISMDIEWWDVAKNLFIKHEKIDVPTIIIK